MPRRSHFSDKVIPKVYDETKSKVCQEMKKANLFDLTTDGWTSRATK